MQAIVEQVTRENTLAGRRGSSWGGGSKLLELQQQLSSLQLGLYLLAGGGLQVQGVSWNGTGGGWGQGRVDGGAAGEELLGSQRRRRSPQLQIPSRGRQVTGTGRLVQRAVGAWTDRAAAGNTGRSRYWWINIKHTSSYIYLALLVLGGKWRAGSLPL